MFVYHARDLNGGDDGGLGHGRDCKAATHPLGPRSSPTQGHKREHAELVLALEAFAERGKCSLDLGLLAASSH